MRIGEAAAASGCHIETIRYYERVGLLPRPARTGSGYRHYTKEQVQRLRFITRGRALGFTLEEIQGLMALADDPRLPCEDVDRLARVHLADIEQKRRGLARLSRELRTVIASCAGGRRADCRVLQTLQAPAPRR